MQVYLTLVRRELGGYFASLTGYILIAAVLLLLGLSFVDMLVKLNAEPTEAPLTEQFFVTVYFWFILLLTTPVITMRSFALEKFSGTYETLMTSPVKDVQVVLAKFTGALLFYAITWLPLGLYLVLVRHYSNDPAVLNPISLLTTFLGILLVGSLYISMGCFASSLTRSQVVAVMISFALGLGLFFLSLRSLMAAPGTGWPAGVFQFIAMTEHLEDFARGIVDTRCLVYYVTLSFFFLFLTLRVVESRRWR
ncbi:MAG: ABC transporter permease [Verrucomicrobia bacterium]|nr:ABC transporter permease [Verrucomicrobiota bacterium]